MHNKVKKKELYIPIALISILAILSYVRILFLHNVFEDDNCWLLSIYSSSNLSEFLNTGAAELRRIPSGIFAYYFFKLHKATNYAYWILQSINLLIQIASPILLFLFTKNLFKGKQLLALFIGCSLIIYPIDITLPVLTICSYRIGIMLTLISFYITVKALTDNIRWTFLIFALVISAISYYVFLEGTVAFEPARLAIIGYIFYKKGIEFKSLVKKSFAIWSLFLILCIPLVIYKIIFRPYGIYAGMYSLSFSTFFNWDMQKQLLKILFLQNWYNLSRLYFSFTTFWSVLLAFWAIVVSYLFFVRSKSFYDENLKVSNQIKNNWRLMLKENINSVTIVFILGVILLIPPVLMYELAGKIPTFGVNSRHGVVLQIGYSFLLGSLLYVFYTTLYNIQPKFRAIKNLIIIFIGLGIFYNNMNLDLYFDSWHNQKDFWQEFTRKFPSLPERITFFIDAKDEKQPYSYNLDTSYDLEFVINLLYARNDNPKFFRKYIVLAPDELQLNEKLPVSFERISHWGKDIINRNQMIIVTYRDKKILTNVEVLPNNQKNIYISDDLSFYPLRYKLKGFY